MGSSSSSSTTSSAGAGLGDVGAEALAPVLELARPSVGGSFLCTALGADLGFVLAFGFSLGAAADFAAGGVAGPSEDPFRSPRCLFQASPPPSPSLARRSSAAGVPKGASSRRSISCLASSPLPSLKRAIAEATYAGAKPFHSAYACRASLRAPSASPPLRKASSARKANSDAANFGSLDALSSPPRALKPFSALASRTRLVLDLTDLPIQFLYFGSRRLLEEVPHVFEGLHSFNDLAAAPRLDLDIGTSPTVI
eukprot:CAMPEP_0181405058 /NCGR_PEP_ID=MMETSP1110-20121109/4568_1 /TAXON_ID=174948 /ORGANISM="Symbiodinium sp., Strain CCMP421" /LENGTH=253 /DNA_ID=CAMNT_0023527443 /DNA_START=131 /DNA_END=893 /DNA_ORIENTATION=+